MAPMRASMRWPPTLIWPPLGLIVVWANVCVVVPLGGWYGHGYGHGGGGYHRYGPYPYRGR